MRIFAILAVFILFAVSFSFNACKSGPKNFCDTACISDTIRFSIEHPAQPYVSIGMKNCLPDTFTWSHNWLPSKKKMVFTDLTNEEVRINSKFIRCYIKDTSYVWVVFNDCFNGQGYISKIPFGKGNIFRKNSAFTSFDPKFIVPENMIAYTDKGNIFVEDMATGKKAMLTFGQMLDIDYNNMHDKIDSVVITPTYMRARINIDNSWKIVDRNITLE